MTLLSKGTVIAAASAVAIVLAVSGGATAQTKKDAKMSAPPPAPGFCTASVNVFKWGHLGWRGNSGTVYPTAAMCYDQRCPAKC
jgi:hypothetical protein